MRQFGACGLAFALLLVACAEKTFEYEWNQRVTVVVQTPDGEVARSGVIRAYYHFGQRGGGANHTWRTLAGEYPAINLGDRRYLVAVMGAVVTSDTDNVVLSRAGKHALALTPRNSERPYSIVDWVRGLRDVRRDAPTSLPDGAPLFVTFDDPDDPLTVRRVDRDEFETVFGPGYRLKSVTIELTDDPVTEGVMRRVFPWLVDVWRKGGSIDGTVGTSLSNPNRLADILGKGSFTMEDFEVAD